MEQEYFEFDAGVEIPTVDKVGLKQKFAEPVVQVQVTKTDLLRDKVYTEYVKGYPPPQIAKKNDLSVAQVVSMIAQERKVREGLRKESGPLSIEDQVAFYNEVKRKALERADYADDKFAAMFFKEASEAQARIDKLLGFEGGPKRAEIPDPDAIEGEALPVYRVRKPIIISEDQEVPTGAQ